MDRPRWFHRPGLCDGYCIGCKYHYGEHGTDGMYCDFYFKTGVRRGCPAGTGCLRFTWDGKHYYPDDTPLKRFYMLKKKERKKHEHRA